MSQPSPICVICGANAPAGASYCIQCQTSLDIDPNAPVVRGDVEPRSGIGAAGGPRSAPSAPAQPSTKSSKIRRRYADGYRVANFLETVGGILKVVAWIALAVLFIATIAVAANNPYQVEQIVLLGAVVTIGVPLNLWLVGLVISALGQITRAQLDVAVNTSPHIGEEDKASIMSL